jgi:hypothetical protein
MVGFALIVMALGGTEAQMKDGWQAGAKARRSPSAMWLSENRRPGRSTPTTTEPRPVQVSSH